MFTSQQPLRLQAQERESLQAGIRVWHKAGLQPHRLRRYKARPDRDFERKAKEVWGLYLNPPEKAVVFCVDEKTATQASDRTQPALPLAYRNPKRRIHVSPISVTRR